LVYLFYKGLILRMAGAAVVSFLTVLLLGPPMIRFLIKRKIGERPEFDHADLNQLTRHKSNTPTMGGILIVIAVFVSILLFANTYNNYVRMALFALVWLGLLGGIDDWMKLRAWAGKGSGREGLRMWEKLVFQVGLAVMLAVSTYAYGRESTVDGVNPAHSLYLPFRADPIPLGLLAYAIVTVLTMVGSSNAVNLTDGMDGLAAGCVMIVAAVLLLLSEIVGVRAWARFFHLPLVAGSVEMTVVCAAMLGACLGFLWYNAHPAQVFMGDTGSLPLGGLIGYIAVVTRQELLLVIAGGVFVMEAGSVLLQVGCFKLTKRRGGVQGRRLFRCAPLHHHFHLGGWAESKVVVRFWLLGIIFAALALATLKLR
jgi:phospho-N-acetylmuramoyl-pentapeptide-transferase